MKKTGLAAVVVLATAVGAWWALADEGYTPRPLPPIKPSTEFRASAMVPALETPLPAGTNTLWCGAFQLAWNRLKTDVAREPVRVSGAQPLCDLLNGSPFGDVDLTPESFFAAAGFRRDGIVDHIRREMGARGVDPDLSDLRDVEAMAYAHLQARLRFKTPYRERSEGITFRDGAGRVTRVKGFGMGYGVKAMPLYHFGGANDFVVDLDTQSKPHQILLAMMKRPTSLAEAVESLKTKTPTQPLYGDVPLMVPDVAFGLVHRFVELEGEDKLFLNAALKDSFLARAQQSIQFRLDRGGAELKAEARIDARVASAPARIPAALIFDRPFLLVMKTRGAANPYLAVWIDNAELLDPR